ncbi:cytochrome c oxidase assembly protein [Saxibacter everestensis]|uniref:Cytochrome c oxidase assembly protein n=1 Tax=Saxibacter everestensis TaxID=2909229 RepID=A0ABY8QSH4_9MICO|nr:cytochrome c oxidase assembly protein [Brevibacteriaceae bacterium ZFBP1038]
MTTSREVAQRPLAADVGLALAAIAAVITLVGGLAFSGAAAASLINDPGVFVRWGLPAAELVYNVSLAVTAGVLALAAVAIPRTASSNRQRKGTESQPLNPAWERALGIASASSVVWTLSSVAVLVLSYIDTAGEQALRSGNFSAQLGLFVTQLDTGRAWLVIALTAAVVSTLIFGVRSLTGIGLLTLATIFALIPQALIGHAAGSDNHELAVGSIGLHIFGVVLWFGGLLGLCLLSGILTSRATASKVVPGGLADVVSRFSNVALFAYLLVVFSGVVNASIRLGGWDGLLSGYGALVVLKSLAALALGGVGWWHRRYIVRRLGDAAAAAKVLFWRLIAGEMLLFGIASGAAVALSRTAPPVPQEPPVEQTPARFLTGYDLPPELTPSRWFTEWAPDPIWIAIAGFAIIAYCRGVWVVRKRGDHWPIHRMVLWIFGMLALIYITSGGGVVYGRVLFSAHMVQHMTLAMAIPLPMVLGAPVTLLMRAVPARRDDSRGPREWVLAAVHSRFARFMAHPLIAAINFAGSIIVFYYSPLFGLALRTHVGHELMIVHFLIAGYLFAQALVGIDPGPTRFSYPLRLVLLLATMAFHAFFGVTLMGSTVLLEASWFGNMGRDWGGSALADQQEGGGIAWGIGEFPTFLLAVIVAVQWARSSDREAKRSDRKEARTGDAELRAYNEMLAKLADSDKK